jgi:hypothetical protein
VSTPTTPGTYLIKKEAAFKSHEFKIAFKPNPEPVYIPCTVIAEIANRVFIEYHETDGQSMTWVDKDLIYTVTV